MTVKLLTGHNLDFLSLKGGCTGSYESTHVKFHIVGNHMSLKYSMTVKLLTGHNLDFLSLKGGCTGSCQSTHVKFTLLIITFRSSFVSDSRVGILYQPLTIMIVNKNLS